MNIAATILIAALSIGTNGNVEFIDYDSWRSVEGEDIPGSEEWYTEIDSILTPKMWRVWRNGHVVTNTFAAPPLHTHIPIELHFVPPSPTYEGVDISDWYSYIDINDDYNRRAIRLPGESDPEPSVVAFFPGIVGITWDSHAGSTNFHYRAYPIEFDTNKVADVYADRKIFMPRAPRLSQTSRDSLVSTFDAYFERLYYASQGNKNDWDEDDWGTTSAGPDFEFSPTNVYIATTPRFDIRYPGSETNEHRRRIDPSTRLLDAPNIRRLVANMKGLFPSFLKIEPVSTQATIPPQDIMDARPFMFRPHWLTDPRDYPRGDLYGSSLWWGSSAPWPAADQTVSTNDLDVIFPAFDWTEFELPGEFNAIDWSSHSIALDMAIPDTGTFITMGEQTPIPCAELFRALESMDDSKSSIEALLNEINTYDSGCTVLGLLTNAFPRAAKTLPSVEKAFEAYRDGVVDESLRLTTTEIAIANQLFAIMDRTVHIPSMCIVTTNDHHIVRREGTYKGYGDSVKVKYGIVDGRLVIEEIPGGISFRLELDNESEINSVYEVVRHAVHAETTTPTFSIPSSLNLGDSSSGGDIIVEDYYEFMPGTNVVSSIVPLDQDGVGLRLIDSNGNTIVLARAMEGFLEDLIVSPPKEVNSHRVYEYEDPMDVTGSVMFGPTQPGVESLTAENEYANLYRLYESFMEPDFGDIASNTVYRWRSDGGESYYGREDICSAGESAISQCRDELASAMCERLFENPLMPDTYAPFPSTIKINGSLELEQINPRSVPDEYPFEETEYRESWDLYFDIPSDIYVFASLWYTQRAWRFATNIFDVVESYYVKTNGEVVTELATTNMWGREEGEAFYDPRVPEHNLDHFDIQTNIVVWEVTTYDKEETYNPPSLVYSNVYEFTLHPDCQEGLYERYRIFKHTRYEDPDKDPETEHLTNTTFYGVTEFHLDPDESHYENSYIDELTLGFDDASRVVTNTTKYTVYKIIEIVADERGRFKSASMIWIDPVTGEELREPAQMPLYVGVWNANPRLYYHLNNTDAHHGGEKGYYFGDIIFRTMTRTTWPWNAMHLERNNQ